MNKKEFKEFLKNKKVVLKNVSHIKLLALQEKNKLIKFYLNQFNRNDIFFKYVDEEKTKIAIYYFKKDRKNCIELQVNLLSYSKMLKKYNRTNEVLVRSTDFKINNVIFNFRDIEILSDKTFKSKNNSCVFEVMQ